MTDQTTNNPESMKNRIYEIARKIFLFSALGLILITIYKMASKKLGGF